MSGYPLDSIKSRLQVKRYASVLDCARDIWRTEGVKGYYRGVAMPLVTVRRPQPVVWPRAHAVLRQITIVRTASFTIYNTVKEELHKRGHFDRPTIPHKAISGLLGGATAGVMISVGSCTFELIKVGPAPSRLGSSLLIRPSTGPRAARVHHRVRRTSSPSPFCPSSGIVIRTAQSRTGRFAS